MIDYILGLTLAKEATLKKCQNNFLGEEDPNNNSGFSNIRDMAL